MHDLPRVDLARSCLAVAPRHACAGRSDFAKLARSAGQPQIPGLRIVYLTQLGDPAQAPWKNIILHQTEGAPGAARSLAEGQAKNPTRRGVTLWVETDGTVYWSTPETVVTTHGDGANRNDNKYIDNSKTYRQVIPGQFNWRRIQRKCARRAGAADAASSSRRASLLVRFLQERYGIPAERIYAHNWIDYKDARYCEGCELASAPARRAIGRGRVNYPGFGR